MNKQSTPQMELREKIAKGRSTNVLIMGQSIQLVTFEEKQLIELIEAYANQAVLSALEEVERQARIYDNGDEFLVSIKLFELTAIKQRYEGGGND